MCMKQEGGAQRPSWALWFQSVSVALFSLSLFPIKFLVEQENEQVDVDGGAIEELHHRHALVLQLEQILRNNTAALSSL